MRKFPCILCGRSTTAKTFHGKYCDECKTFNSIVAKIVYSSHRYIFWKEH